MCVVLLFSLVFKNENKSSMASVVAIIVLPYFLILNRREDMGLNGPLLSIFKNDDTRAKHNYYNFLFFFARIFSPLSNLSEAANTLYKHLTYLSRCFFRCLYLNIFSLNVFLLLLPTFPHIYLHFTTLTMKNGARHFCVNGYK